MIPYIIKSFRGGISDESDKGIAGSYKYGYNLDIHAKDDTLSCGSTMATIDCAHDATLQNKNVDGLVTAFVSGADGGNFAQLMISVGNV